MHGLSGPPYSALNRRSTDHSQFGVDSDDLTDKALKKKKALQEKSKRAQRRYRERKKAEAEELKKQIEDLSRRLSTLTAEKNQLQNRNSLLEKVVQVRGGGGDVSTSAQALDISGNVPDYVAASATFLGLVYPGRRLERSIRKEHMDNMTSEDYRKVWRDYINKLTHLLLAAEGDAGGAAVEQIRELVESQRWAVQCYGKSDMSKLMKISMDIRREGSPRFTSVDAARKLMARLGLTMDQKFRIAAVRRQFVARLQGIQRGRAMAAAALQSPIPERFDDVSALQSFSEDSIVQEGHMQALIREQQETFALAQYGIREILTPVQDARLLVDAFPQPPDPMLLSRLVAEELHDPSAQFAIEGVPSTVPGNLRPLLAPALDSTEFPPLPGDFFEPPPDHNNTGIPPAHTVTTGFI
ncbi:g10382 [Coccomyxa elongata]